MQLTAIFFMHIKLFSPNNNHYYGKSEVIKMKKRTIAIIIFLFAMFLFSNKQINQNPNDNFINTIADTDKKIAEFTTKFNKKSFGRASNIKLSAKAIDEKEIMPGETFSFNNVVGPTTKENGYKMAQIFVKGKKKKGYGGGVCQVSSTLYNAVLGANLKVIERHSHSKKVYYVEDDKDAATSYGGIDFKFINDKDYTIKINSYIYDDTITVALYKA